MMFFSFFFSFNAYGPPNPPPPVVLFFLLFSLFSQVFCSLETHLSGSILCFLVSFPCFSSPLPPYGPPVGVPFPEVSPVLVFCWIPVRGNVCQKPWVLLRLFCPTPHGVLCSCLWLFGNFPCFLCFFPVIPFRGFRLLQF